MKVLLHQSAGSSLYIGDWEAAQQESNSNMALLSILSSGWPELPSNQHNSPTMRIMADDSESELLIRFFDQASDFIHRCRADSTSVLVHCHAGRSRSVAICAAYLCKHSGMQLGAALDWIKSQHPQSGPSANFMRQLDFYVNKFQCSIAHPEYRIFILYQIQNYPHMYEHAIPLSLLSMEPKEIAAIRCRSCRAVVAPLSTVIHRCQSLIYLELTEGLFEIFCEAHVKGGPSVDIRCSDIAGNLRKRRNCSQKLGKISAGNRSFKCDVCQASLPCTVIQIVASKVDF